MKDKKIKYCKTCKKKTEHIKRGFGTPGGLCGNGRYSCKICGEERT